MNSNTMKSRTLGAIVAFAGAFGVALAAQAGEAAVAPGAKYADVVVDFGDLNLASEAGARVLYGRLADAADRACGGEPPARELQQRMRYEACFNAKLERAVQKVGHQTVIELHADKVHSAVG